MRRVISFAIFHPCGVFNRCPCDGNLNSSKISHLKGHNIFLKDITVDTFVHSSSAHRGHDPVSRPDWAPSWQTFLSLASGWALATELYTITTYLWLTEATTVKHFSRF